VVGEQLEKLIEYLRPMTEEQELTAAVARRLAAILDAPPEGKPYALAGVAREFRTVVRDLLKPFGGVISDDDFDQILSTPL
jgi:hypothetical protein